MKFLHTSDWHLGQRLLGQDRIEEQADALNQLLDIIQAEQIDVLLVSGDIFDTTNPTHASRQLYYRFLTQLLSTPCRHIVITGGNHDSPSFLEAPRELLETLQIYVVGAVPAQPEYPLIPLCAPDGCIKALVAAVPFLRDRDLRQAVPNETGPDRIAMVREALGGYFQAIGEEAAVRSAQLDIPVIAMGHLWVSGADASDRQDNIYFGDTENITTAAFPDIFSYVALGHIHRAQIVGRDSRVRYSGSLIPLSFSETKDEKSVYVLEYEGAQLIRTETKAITAPRRLKTITGSTLEEVKASVERFASQRPEKLNPWLDVLIESDYSIPGIEKELIEFAKAKKMELLKLRLLIQNRKVDVFAHYEVLEDLHPMEVFQRLCESKNTAPQAISELTNTFRELLESLSAETPLTNP